MTDTAGTYRVVVSQYGQSWPGQPIQATDVNDAIDQARTTASGMPGGMSFQLLSPDGTVLREFSR